MKDHTVVIQPAFQQVHLRATDETRYRNVGRFVIDLRCGAGLLNRSLMQYDDFVAEGQSLSLVMGHVNNRGVQPAVQPSQLHPHGGPERSIEIRQRLVEKKNFRLSYDGAPQRHSLSLPAALPLRGAAQPGGRLPPYLNS